MIQRVLRAVRHAAREQDFLPILGAAVLFVVIGTMTYTLAEDWNVVDGFYFAIATLTTSSVADPDLVLEHAWTKVFTSFYVLIGIGILVETGRRLAFAFVEVLQEDKARKDAPKEHPAGSDD